MDNEGLYGDWIEFSCAIIESCVINGCQTLREVLIAPHAGLPPCKKCYDDWKQKGNA